MSIPETSQNPHILATASRLRVEPNDVFLRDSTNRAWLLRGVNLSGSCKFPKYPTPVPSHIGGDAFLKRPLTTKSNAHGGDSTRGNVTELNSSMNDYSNEGNVGNYEEYNQDEQFKKGNKTPDDGEISFVGRPFELEEADEHLARLRHWGFRMIRWVVTWEAVEHQGPGIYDLEFLDYTVSALLKAKEYGFKVMIDFHQDVWSRFSGGSGAPLWTLYAAGLDPFYFAATGAATVHNTLLDDEPLLRMAWLTNYYKLACASMFTLFYAGKILAPQCTFENGVNIQDYLQSHFLNAIQVLVNKIHDCRGAEGSRSENLLEDVVVVGYDSWNEPSCGWIGLKRLDELPEEHDMRQGDMPTPFQSLMLGEGLIARDVDTYQLKLVGPVKSGSRTIDPSQHPTSHQKPVKAWLSPRLREEYDIKYGIRRDSTYPKPGECIWAQHGVWSIEDGKLLQQDYFSIGPSKDSVSNNEPINWVNDHWLPFAKRVTDVIRNVHPTALIFLEPPVYVPPPHLGSKDQPADTKTSGDKDAEYSSLTQNMVYAPHHYDDLVLLTKKYLGWINIDILGLSRGRHKSLAGSIILGKKSTENLFGNQIDSIQNECYERLGRRPVLIGETGLHFDVGLEEAYQSGNIRKRSDRAENNSGPWLRRMKECIFGRSNQKPTAAWERHQFQQAFDNILNGLERTLAHYTLWNYTIENDDQYGDGWNGENLSIYSKDAIDTSIAKLNTGHGNIYHELDIGGRAIEQFCRPYPIATVGSPFKIQFDRIQKTFQLWTRTRSDQKSNLEIDATTESERTEIYIPRIHFRGASVKLRGNGDQFSGNSYLESELLFPDFSITQDCYDRGKGEHYVVICEAKPPITSDRELEQGYIKLANMMKLSLDKQIEQGYDDSTVEGFLFEVIADRMQLCKLLMICPVLGKAKDMVLKTLDHLRLCRKLSISPKTHLRRPSYDIQPIYIKPQKELEDDQN
ncbi:hypothetical protein BGZ76_003300 [Entomortierella beljakovae]|nr:hypothetical protein BGZ76_003300 [Entomortierella beljakovae]